jgi:cysteine sulfinate desulfinase/cysteine desulfurase-like protein
MAVYLDCNATTPVASTVVRKITDTLNYEWGNPSSHYDLGVKSKKIIEEARRHVALMIDCKSEDVIFTSGGTEVCEIHWFVKVVIESLPYCHNLYFSTAMTLRSQSFLYLPLMLYNLSS